MSGYTKVDNWLFDEVMPKAKPNTFKVVSAVVRKTAGWGKKSDRISARQLQKMTGIKSLGTLQAAINDALEHGYIERESVGQMFTYCYGNCNSSVTETVTPTVTEIVTEGVTETVTTKGKNQNKSIKGESDPLLDLVEYFCELTGIRSPNGKLDRRAETWLEPLVDIYHAAGDDYGATKLRMKAAVDRMREIEYTIATPKSIKNTALSINPAKQVLGVSDV
ncbi:MAG: replication protein [Dehalococcoidales bacterium]